MVIHNSSASKNVCNVKEIIIRRMHKQSLQSARSTLLLRKLGFLKRTLSDGATGVGIDACRPGHARALPGYFESCVLISRRPDARSPLTLPRVGQVAFLGQWHCHRLWIDREYLGAMTSVSIYICAQCRSSLPVITNSESKSARETASFNV